MIGREGGLGGRSKLFFGSLKKNKKAKRKRVGKRKRRVKMKQF